MIAYRPPAKWAARASWPWLVVGVLASCKRVYTSSGPPTPEQLAEACIKLTACDPRGGNVESCIADVGGFASTASADRENQIRCLADAFGSCDAILRCIGISVSTCPMDEYMVHCDGDSLVSCDNGIQYAFDCGYSPYAPDGTCIANECGLSSCTMPGQTRCNGSRLEHCSQTGILTATDCTAFGEECLDDDAPHCARRGALPCGFPHCDGEVLVQCAGPVERRFDCANMLAGGVCLDRSITCGYGDECAPFSAAVCIGTTLSLCVLGEQVEIDCTSLGFSTCRDGNCSLN